jgi:3-oxoacyl-[acyl-carrier protein] reductase
MAIARQSMSIDFSNRVALITGAEGMIGSAVARRLAAGGAAVCLAGLSRNEELERDLADQGAEFLSAGCDVTDLTQIKGAVSKCLERFGRLDILVTAAGVTSVGSFETITVEEWDRVHNINLRGVFLTNQAVIGTMKRQGFGRIVNVGSVLAKNGGNPRPWLNPDEQAKAGNAAYGAAKAGVHALTLFLAKEGAAHGIMANVVAPGPVASPMTTSFPEALVQQIPVGRMGKDSEVANIVAFLCAEENTFITGEVVDINGGLWMD